MQKVNAKEAAQLILISHPEMVINKCTLMSHYYVFSIIPKNLHSVELYLTGTTLPAIDINTGKETKVNILDFPFSNKKSREIPLKELI